MTRRDPKSSNRQAGSYRSEDAWDTPGQANQWQSDSTSQAGGSWDHDEDQRTSYFGNTSQRGDRYTGSGSRYGGGSSDYSRDDNESAYGERSYRPTERSSYGEHRDRGNYGRGSAGQNYGRNNQNDRGYRFSGGQDQYPAHSYDASGGNDFNSFTSEDFGGRDFARGREAPSGGARPSNTYRESWGPGSWSSHDSERSSERSGKDYGDWQQYGRSRGFLDRAGDEIASWFGDEDASRRREQDHRGRGPSDYTRSDERIREDVNDSLTHDWRLDASSIRVTVKDGEVSLEGTVGSRQDKRRAEDLADDVTGVRHVQNNLRVQNSSDRSGLTAGTSTPGYSHTSSTGSTTTGSSSTSGSGTSSGSPASGSATSSTIGTGS